MGACGTSESEPIWRGKAGAAKADLEVAVIAGVRMCGLLPREVHLRTEGQEGTLTAPTCRAFKGVQGGAAKEHGEMSVPAKQGAEGASGGESWGEDQRVRSRRLPLDLPALRADSRHEGAGTPGVEGWVEAGCSAGCRRAPSLPPRQWFAGANEPWEHHCPG